MTAPLVQRLSLVVDAATGGTEARMEALATASREAGQAAERSAGQVAAAAERVAAAQLRRDDAVDRVTLAERRLLEVQGRYAAGSSQVLAAEQRLEAARRNLHVATRGVERATEDQARAQDDATEATARAATEEERARVGAERLGSQMENLRAQAGQLVGGFLVGDWLRDQTTAYLEGARGAQTLAASMNATIEQGGQLSQLFTTLGLDSADLLEIQAEFATKIGEGGRNLQTFGAAVQTNANGTVNWAGTLVDALTHLQRIPDATERNRLGFQLFGEEGYKQLSRLLTSGMSVEEALDAIGTPFTAEDVRTAQEYDRELMRMNLSSGELGRTISRAVVPVAADLAEGAADVVTAVSQIPLPLSLAGAAAITMGRTGFDPLTRASDAARGGFDRLRDAVSTAAAGVDASAGRVSRAAGVARAGVGQLTGALGGPAGVALLAIGGAWAAASAGAEALEESAREAAVELEEMGGTTEEQLDNSRRLARQLYEEAGLLERLSASYRANREARDENAWFDPAGFGGLFGAMGEGEGATRGFELAIEDARKELGEFGAQQALATQTSQSLNNLIAEGTTSGRAFTTAVEEAARAQAEESRTSDLAAASIAAYRATTDQAVQSVRNLIDAQLSQLDASYGFLSAMDAANAATDDTGTSVDEVAEAHLRLQQAALTAADAAADAAVAQAQAAGRIVTPLEEARLRADTMINDLQLRLNTPGLSTAAQEDLQGLVDRLREAQENGDVAALVTLTGVDDAEAGLDEVSGDRESRVNVESRGGPAVDRYLDRLSNDRLSRIRVESRNGPAVDRYLDGLAAQRLAIIRVETRGGPAVDAYLDRLAARRTAIIDVQRTGDTGGAGGPAGAYAAGAYTEGSVTIQSLNVYPQTDAGGRLTQQSLAEAGRTYARALRAHEGTSGTGWRTRGRRT